jgi:hypothetical protein
MMETEEDSRKAAKNAKKRLEYSWVKTPERSPPSCEVKLSRLVEEGFAMMK